EQLSLSCSAKPQLFIESDCRNILRSRVKTYCFFIVLPSHFCRKSHSSSANSLASGARTYAECMNYIHLALLRLTSPGHTVILCRLPSVYNKTGKYFSIFLKYVHIPGLNRL